MSQTVLNIFRHSRYACWTLTALRLYVGYLWLIAGWSKLFNPVWTGDKAGFAVTGFLNKSLTLTSGSNPEVLGPFAAFVKEVALPNAVIFSYLVTWGELLVGLALILGLFTSWALLGGMVMNFNYLMAGVSSINPPMLVAEMILLVAGFNAAKVGLDFWISQLIQTLNKNNSSSNINNYFKRNG